MTSTVRVGCRVLEALALFPSAALPSDLVAQDPDRVNVSVDRLRSLDTSLATFTPRSGPPGTTVRLRVRDMPPLAPLRIGVGALHVGFEESAWVLSDDRGEFTTDVVIPSWGRNDVVHLFIVFDPYFNPIALTEVFHVTDRDGVISRTGIVSRLTTPCPTLQGDDGIAYGIAGKLDALADGVHVTVEGLLSRSEGCSGGPVIDVVRHHTAPPGRAGPR